MPSMQRVTGGVDEKFWKEEKERDTRTSDQKSVSGTQ